VVCVGGGHCNCLVLKLLKASLPPTCKLTLVSEAPMSYYSGMLPGASSRLYRDEQIMIMMEPLAKWCNADFI
jgi:selenide, water dikinase